MSVVVAALFLSGCETMAGGQDQPAVISEPSAASRSALQQVISAAVGVDVLLADDALTESSTLSISRPMPRGINGSPAQGRVMEPPMLFRLVKSGDDCVLIDERNASRHRLADTSCIAEQG